MLVSFNLNHLPTVNLIGQSICTSDWRLYPRKIVDYELLFFYQGEAVFYLEDMPYHLKSGDVLLQVPDQIHRGVTDRERPCRYYYVHFTPENLVNDIPESEVRQQILTITSTHQTEKPDFFLMPQVCLNRVFLPIKTEMGSYRDEIFTLFEKALAERNQLTVNGKVMISIYITQIMVLLTRLLMDELRLNSVLSFEGGMPRVVQEAILYIQENYQEPLTVTSVCKRLEVSPQYLIRLFQQKLGKTPLQYLNNLRISKAKDLLRDASLTMKEITNAVGLDNPYYFSRLFKKTEGISPSEFKQGLNSKSNE